MEVTQITAVIGAAASLLCTLVVGALTFFIKKTLTSLEEADKKNAAQIAESKKEAAAQEPAQWSFFMDARNPLPGIHPFRALEKKKNFPILAKTGGTGYNRRTGMALNHYK